MSYFGMGFGPMDTKPRRREYRLIKVKKHLENKIKREKDYLPKDAINLKKQREGLLNEFEKRSKDRKSVIHLIFIIIILLVIITIVKILDSLKTLYFNINQSKQYNKEQIMISNRQNKMPGKALTIRSLL